MNSLLNQEMVGYYSRGTGVTITLRKEARIGIELRAAFEREIREVVLDKVERDFRDLVRVLSDSSYRIMGDGDVRAHKMDFWERSIEAYLNHIKNNAGWLGASIAPNYLDNVSEIIAQKSWQLIYESLHIRADGFNREIRRIISNAKHVAKKARSEKTLDKAYNELNSKMRVTSNALSDLWKVFKDRYHTFRAGCDVPKPKIMFV